MLPDVHYNITPGVTELEHDQIRLPRLSWPSNNSNVCQWVSTQPWLRWGVTWWWWWCRTVWCWIEEHSGNTWCPADCYSIVCHARSLTTANDIWNNYWRYCWYWFLYIEINTRTLRRKILSGPILLQVSDRTVNCVRLLLSCVRLLPCVAIIVIPQEKMTKNR